MGHSNLEGREHGLKILVSKQFVPMDKDSEKEATEPETMDETWKLSALRSVIDDSFDAHNTLDKSLELVSL